MTWKKGNRSIRSGPWRYTRYRDGGEELYDQVSDPYEWTNLASDPRFSEILTKLQMQIDAH